MTDTTRCEKQETLLEISNKISKEYISSVLLVDDHIAFDPQDGDDSTIDAGNFINDLARHRITVCPYLWNKEGQLDNIIQLTDNSDVSIFDWKIQLQDHYSETGLDSDVEDSGDRGKNAKILLQSIIKQNTASPHLVIIYTEEPTEVQEYLLSLYKSYQYSELLENHHVWISPQKNIRISLFFKNSLSNTHGIKESRVIHNSTEMITAIISEFAELHKGIVPLSLLHSLSILRQNTSKLLSVFNEDLDPAFILHKALSSDPTDGDALLLQTFLDAFSALFFYQNRERFDCDNLVQAWFDDNSAQLSEGLFSAHVKKYPKVDLKIGHAERKEWLKTGYFSFLKTKISEQLSSGDSTRIDEVRRATEEWIKSRDPYTEFLGKIEQCFVLQDATKMNKSNADFAILTHHKSIFAPTEGFIPVLLLGCIIRRKSNEEYFLCIQQSCDCLRITGERQFLFLPLSRVSEGSFDLILPASENNEYVKLTVNHKTSYLLKTIVFRSHDGDDVVKANKDQSDNYCFIDNQNEEYVWCCDLKESFALHFLNEYVHALTRVGVDQSEWLRRS